MKKIVKIIVGVIIGFIIIIGLGVWGLMKDIPTLKALKINDVDISKVADGQYVGKYEFSRWNSEVNVTVKDGKIISIERISEPLTPDVSQDLFDKMIDKQKIDVDVVTGATATSKAYMKSVENALSENK